MTPRLNRRLLDLSDLERYIRREFPPGSYGRSAAFKILKEAMRLARQEEESEIRVPLL